MGQVDFGCIPACRGHQGLEITIIISCSLIIIHLSHIFLLYILADLVNLPDGAKEVKSKITDEWVVKLEDGIEANELAHEHGFRNMGPVGDLKGYYLFKKLRTKSIHPPLKTASTVIFHERQVKRMRYKRNVNIKDPLYNEQWHLHNTKYGLNTLQLWNQGIMGENITIAIVDDGLETSKFTFRAAWILKY